MQPDSYYFSGRAFILRRLILASNTLASEVFTLSSNSLSNFSFFSLLVITKFLASDY